MPVLRTSDPHLSTEDIALGYKQLLEVERGWRDMKQVLDLRPVYHRLEDRIRAHVVLCWLALLLARITSRPKQAPHPAHRRGPAPAPGPRPAVCPRGTCTLATRFLNPPGVSGDLRG
jgi:hypothetical protein